MRRWSQPQDFWGKGFPGRKKGRTKKKTKEGGSELEQVREEERLASPRPRTGTRCGLRRSWGQKPGDTSRSGLHSERRCLPPPPPSPLLELRFPPFLGPSRASHLRNPPLSSSPLLPQVLPLRLSKFKSRAITSNASFYPSSTSFSSFCHCT